MIPRLPSYSSEPIPTWKLVVNSASEKQLAAICEKNRLVKQLTICNTHFYSPTESNESVCKYRLMVNDKQSTFDVYTNDPDFKAPQTDDEEEGSDGEPEYEVISLCSIALYES